jgi:hypothetical protein
MKQADALSCDHGGDQPEGIADFADFPDEQKFLARQSDKSVESA